MNILVTGGAGSIGSETVRRLIPLGHHVRVMDINEEGLWLLGTELPHVDCLLGDVQFEDDLTAGLRGMDAVIHCAAYKHVHLCERNHVACMRVNVEAVRLLMEHRGDRRIVFVSTDKAVGPHSWMGRSKRMAEAVVLAGRGNVVRFGNVLGSRGSLVPAVIRYRDLGKPIPLTDGRMTRFFMGIDEAVTLILEALALADAGRVLASRTLRSARLIDFLEVCRDLLYPGAEIVTVGPRPGERMHEMIDVDGKRIRSDEPEYLMKRSEIGDFLRDGLKLSAAQDTGGVIFPSEIAKQEFVGNLLRTVESLSKR